MLINFFDTILHPLNPKGKKMKAIKMPKSKMKITPVAVVWDVENQKIPVDSFPEICQAKPEQKAKSIKVYGLDRVDQLFINSCDESYRSTGDSWYYISTPHADTFKVKYKIIFWLSHY